MSMPEMRVCAANGMTMVACASSVRLCRPIVALGQRDDRAALRRLVGEAGQQRRLGELPLGHAGDRQELGRHAVAESDGAGLVEQQRIDIAGGFDRAAGGGDDVEADQPVHAGNADRREQAADRGRDQGDEQRDSTVTDSTVPE